MIKLIVVRHGNTFNKGETPTRVGARTDLPLVESGREQAAKLGQYLVKFDLLPVQTFAAPLKRTMETARIALDTAGLADETVNPTSQFTEIDYGVDENKTEDEVIARIGQAAIDEWNANATVPEGWVVDVPAIIKAWQDFAEALEKNGDDNMIAMVVTSNGIARFAPYIAGNFDEFAKGHEIKMGTGCLSVFTFGGDSWAIDAWNIKPKEFV